MKALPLLLLLCLPLSFASAMPFADGDLPFAQGDYQELDPQTRHDLEVDSFSTELKKYAKSEMAQERIDWLLRHPSLDVNEIRRRQIAIQTLAENTELFESLSPLFAIKETGVLKDAGTRILKMPETIDLEGIENQLQSKTLGLNQGHLGLSFGAGYMAYRTLVNVLKFDSAWSLFPIFMNLVLGDFMSVMISGQMPTVAMVERANQSLVIEKTLTPDQQSERLRELGERCAHDASFARRLSRFGSILFKKSRTGVLVTRTFGASVALSAPAWAFARAQPNRVREMISTVVELEVYYAFAKYYVAHKSKLIFPEVATDDVRVLQMINGQHPTLIEQLRETIVPNSLELSDTKVGYIVTGPNAGGKTTFQQTYALLTLLGMVGLPVPAKTFRFSPMFIYTNFTGRGGDVVAKISTFKAQGLRVAQMLKHVLDSTRRHPVLLVIDEILTGTSNQEHDALERGTLQVLATTPGVLFTLSTHDRTIADMAEKFPQIGNLHTTLEGHRIEEGVSTDYNAIEVLRRKGAPAIFLDRAAQYMAEEDEATCGDALTR